MFKRLTYGPLQDILPDIVLFLALLTFLVIVVKVLTMSRQTCERLSQLPLEKENPPPQSHERQHPQDPTR